MNKRAIRKQVLSAVADTLEGFGVREIISLAGLEPVDRESIKEAFDALVRELRKRGGK